MKIISMLILALAALAALWLTDPAAAGVSSRQAAAPLGLTPSVEPPTPTPTPTPTATPSPVPVSLAVTLQRPNAPAPSAPWAMPVRLALYPPGDAATSLYTWDVVLDQAGQWSGAFSVASGVYDVRLRNLHTLRNVRRNVAFTGPMALDMGTLREGDANGDNTVNILDFARLRNAYFQTRGAAGFDPTADFDENGTINILDFGLLRGNYFMSGDLEVTGLAGATGVRAAAPVTLTLTPLTDTLRSGEVAGFTIRLDASQQPLAGLDVELFYRPAVLAVTDAAGHEVTAITPGAAFAVVIQNTVDPLTGRIVFSAANFDHVVNGLVDVASFSFQGRHPGAGDVRFGPRSLGSDDVGRQINAAFVQPAIAVEAHRRYLPLITRR